MTTYGDATKTNTNEISRVSCEEQSEGAIPSKNEIATPSGLAMTVTIFTSLVIIHIGRSIMAKLGSKKKPAVARVQTEKRAGEIMRICNERGWQVIVGIEPDKPEDISDIKWLLKNFEKQPGAQIRSGPLKVSPNDYCPCGSGLKYKKCCFDKV